MAWLRWCWTGLLIVGCAPENSSPGDSAAAPADTVAYLDPAAELSAVRYAPGVVSLNDQCPVRRARLNRRVPPTFVNGRAIGFC